MTKGERAILYMLALAVAVLPSAASANGTCVPIAVYQTDGTTAFTNVDISGGAVTTGIIPVQWASHILLRPDVTDASDGITNIRFTVREYQSNISSPQARTVVDCDKAGGVWTCNALRIDYNPQTSGNGKNYVVPIPIAYKYIDITATPTGHGASDTLSLTTAELCY